MAFQYSAREVPKSKRQLRYPAHPFSLRNAAFGIYPFLCAPVLAGETMKSLNFQARVVTDPIDNPLIGWWLEYYFFYVKLTDLYVREETKEMLLNPAFDSATIISNQSATTQNLMFNYAGGTTDINWCRLAYRVIVDHFFRDQDDNYANNTMNDGVSSSISMAQLVGNNFLDSAALEDAVTAVDVAVADGSDANATLDASEVQAAMLKWQQMKLFGLTEMSYDDYLAAQGLSSKGIEEHKPELIRYVRDWQYPSNTIDPTTGAPRSAVSWALRERADKSRYFSEPGFIVGVTVARPKVYLANVDGSIAGQMNDYLTWMPSFLHQVDANSSRKKIAHDQGALATIITDTDGYWVDFKDLLLYGEQYVNTARNRTDGNLIAVPDATLAQLRYPGASDYSTFFVTPASAYWIKHDGVVNLAIASSPMNPLFDTTPRGGVRSGEETGGDF